MRLLLAYPERLENKGYAVEFTKNLMRFFSDKDHYVQVLNGSGDLRALPSDQYYEGNLKDEDWDLIILQDSYSFHLIMTAFSGNIPPVVFIGHDNSWKSRPLPCQNLIAIFSLTDNFRLGHWPSEFISFVRKPVFLSEAHSTNPARKLGPLRAIHFYQSSDVDLSVVEAIVSAVNAILSLHLTIVAPQAIIDVLRPGINSNISMIERAVLDESLAQFHIAIASDDEAIRCLCMAMPVIIAGRRGLGGLVTTENIEAHLQFHFEGRIGGEVGETIPMLFLCEQIKDIQSIFSQIVEDTLKVAEIVKNHFDPVKIFTTVERQLLEAIDLHRSIESEQCASLMPAKVSGIRTIRGKDGENFIVRENNTIVASISDLEDKILQECNGQKTIWQLASSIGQPLGIEAVVAYIKELWFEKIVIFQDGQNIIG